MAQSQQSPPHPGIYIRGNIIPSGMSITKAATRLGVSRVALSNLLNGRSGLSARMVDRLAKAFGADRKRLMDLQAAYDRHKRQDKEKQTAVRAFVPSFLSIKARQIEDWAEGDVNARALLAVLLRKLVHSTSDDLSRVNFPGYDNSQRPGHDGFVEAGSATPWVPVGRSYWEFGTSVEPAVKANKDYVARLKSVSPEERQNSTFVFVTPRNWPSKTAWERKKSETGEWGAVGAYDADDLEQWLEQSVPAQIWLAGQLQLPVSGFETLDQAWSRWAGASEPSLTPEIFAPAVAANRRAFSEWLDGPCNRPFVIAADSRLEALAFLACLFNDPESDSPKQDLVAVFTCPTLLRRLVDSSVPFIPVVHSEDTERALAGTEDRLHRIIFRHRNAVEPNADIELTLLGDEDFRRTLTAMGIDESRVERLARESGHSPTILRRRLSKNSAIRKPEWVANDDTATALVAISLVGAWHSDVRADQEIISRIGDRPYERIEREVSLLLRLDDSPVWFSGSYRGVASKIDALFAVARVVTTTDLKRFLKAALTVLSESDPSLELPEEERWAAPVYDKVRKHSDILRGGVCETLVLLSVHGNHLFRRQLGIDIEVKVAGLVRNLLSPLTVEKLLSHNRDLPHYAEAAPGTFLEIVEEDLARDKPVVFGILKPTRGNPLSASPPRTGLLWALECLAWNPKTVVRVSRILARLSRTRIDDNWANKPDASLKAILSARLPQTAASLPQRLATLGRVLEEFPEVAWKLCVDNVNPRSSFGYFTRKPRWRNDASGAGDIVPDAEAHEFLRQVLALMIGWPHHDEKTLGDLVRILGALPEKHELKLWELIDDWSRGSSEDAKAELREQIRQSISTLHGSVQNSREATRARARRACDSLQADDPVIRYGWLFANEWIRPTTDEMERERFDISRHQESVDRQRRDAMAQVWSTRGFSGILDLLIRDAAASLVGHYAALSESVDGDQSHFVRHCLSIEGDLRSQAEQCLQGFLTALAEYSDTTVMRSAAEDLDGEDLKRLFTCAPFRASTWRLLDNYGDEFRSEYWRNVVPTVIPRPPSELMELVDRLLDARRPRAAFALATFSLDDLETSRLKRMLFDVATGDKELTGHYPLKPYDLGKAMNSLDGRAGVTQDVMARLEFLYIRAFDFEEHGFPNLQAQIMDSPDLFVRMVTLVYKRSDGGEDPPEWKIEDHQNRQAMAMAAHRVLDGIKRIPGEDEDGTIQVKPLTSWITEVRQHCRNHGRANIGDQLIGQLLARAPEGKHGEWPCEAVCHAMEGIASLHIGRGFEIGVYNSRGVQWRGEGGLQERELAATFRDMAERLHFEFPYIGGLLENIANGYEREANLWDSEAEKDKRLGR